MPIGTFVAYGGARMAIPFEAYAGIDSQRDPRAPRILAKTIYRELRQSGLGEHEVIAIASELLSLVAADVKDRRAAGDGSK